MPNAALRPPALPKSIPEGTFCANFMGLFSPYSGTF